MIAGRGGAGSARRQPSAQRRRPHRFVDDGEARFARTPAQRLAAFGRQQEHRHRSPSRHEPFGELDAIHGVVQLEVDDQARRSRRVGERQRLGRVPDAFDSHAPAREQRLKGIADVGVVVHAEHAQPGQGIRRFDGAADG